MTQTTDRQAQLAEATPDERVPPPEEAPDEIAKRLEEDRPANLRLEEGESFIGTYVRLDKGYTSYGESWIMVLADDNGELHGLWLFHAALTNKLKKLRPAPGDRIGIKYLGKRQGSSGNDYADYAVASGAEKAFDWGDVRGGDADGDQWSEEPPPF